MQTKLRAVVSATAMLFWSGCGARSDLRTVSDVLIVDAGRMDVSHDQEIAPLRTCRSEPNCIEADVELESGIEVHFAETGTTIYRQTRADSWLTTEQTVQGIGFQTQVSHFARPGRYQLSLTPTPNGYFADIRLNNGTSCNIHGTGTLTRNDARPDGVTEGTFEGSVTRDCPQRFRVRNGWFRLTPSP